MLERMRSNRENGTVSPSVSQRFKWCFKKHRVLYLLARMDRLQMGLSLMLQIIQLGTSMASTSRHDPPEKVREMSDRMRRERVEAQNVVILYHFETKEVDRLYGLTKNEQFEAHTSLEPRGEEGALSLVPLPEESQLARADVALVVADTDLMIKPPMRVLTEFDENWAMIDQSPGDMIRVTDGVIDKLLEKWTIWRERRDQKLRRPTSANGSQYRSNVQDVQDEEDAAPFTERYQDRDDTTPGGRFLEGPTTDWRRPHSVEARQKAAQLRRAYAGYQPNVSAENSDVDNSPESTGSRRRAPRRHVLNSDDESSASESEKPPLRRRSSTAVPVEETEKIVVQPAMSRSFSTTSTGPNARPPPSQPASRTLNPPTWPSHQTRPFPSPDQNKQQHSFSVPAPVPAPAQYPYPGVYHPSIVSSPQSGPYVPPPYQHQQSYPFPQAPVHAPPPLRYPSRLVPQSSRQVPQIPASREGKPPKSPSRLSHSTHAHGPGRYKETEEEKRARKKQLRRDIGDGAAKTLLAGGGIAVFIEALEALDL